MRFDDRPCSLRLDDELSLISQGLMLLPAIRGCKLTRTGHGLLSPLLIAVCALFVHGLGYQSPRHPLW